MQSMAEISISGKRIKMKKKEKKPAPGTKGMGKSDD